ncbi:MAG: DUF1614 domain-containing protein [Candidatus Abyssobacteria bacterium SURF_5]|uniref:DUF1614 domain-containing protein n=1 Tax=Abyssobacteria bacterium (strain SURF_5) TaxID=2093360 RepID=A0A3A4NXT4_ABYX5|nr:MAG: DUF1614 domain-containing protein [Candidatus Abyssubacteria bacterium SURF_5]
MTRFIENPVIHELSAASVLILIKEKKRRMVPYFPFYGSVGVLVALLLLLVFLLIEVNVIHYAFEKIGINHRYVFLVLLLSFIGSAVNIPLFELPGHVPTVENQINSYGFEIFVPAHGVTVAINVGGALIPTLVSIFLLVKMDHVLRAVLAVVVVSALSFYFATLVPGVGITIPAFIPPVTAALCAILLCRKEAPQIAYISGSLGTLIGADLLNLGNIAVLGSEFVSIGGAGTFDGIFFSSIIAVLLVSI